jgi:ABC-type dipeptide/oligopeptide/nickel transport system ATPase component
VLVLDEPTASLDASTAAALLALLHDLATVRGLAILLVTHDLAVAAVLADRIAVIDAGAMVEAGSTRMLLSAPVHPSTRALVDAATGWE